MRFFSFLISLFIVQAAVTQVVIKNTNVIDVENKKMLEGYNVICRNGKIASIYKGKIAKQPAGMLIIDGEGKYLVPGFTDAHVHFFQSGGLYTRPDVIDLRKYRNYATENKWVHDNMDDFLRRYLSIGITSVIDVGSSYSFLNQRDTFTRKPYAPIIRMTGPLLTTYVPEPYKNLGKESPFELMQSEEGVRKSVRDQLPLKADFIKIWYIVQGADKEKDARKNLPLVQAVIDEAHKNKLRVAVHATERITAQLAVEAGADYLVHSVDDEIVNNDFVKLLRKNKTVLCPTLVVMGNYTKVLGDHYQFTSDELSIANPATIATVLDYPLPDSNMAALYIKSVNSAVQIRREKHADSVMMENLKKLVAGGVTIATGTDAGNIGTQHAGSYFAEIKAMQQSGMTNWELLRASTINGAIAAGEEKNWGSIAKNKWANMLVLDGNPLDSIDNWRKLDWVINKGIPSKPAELIRNTPEMLAQQQLNAYNAHDLDAFMEPYAEDVEIYQFPNSLQVKGKEAMRNIYRFITRTPGLYCRLVKRTVEGNKVTDFEEVWGFGDQPVKAEAIYIIEAGKIKKVYFRQ
jgi:imidazolonepropionase-like amidohydrolase